MIIDITEADLEYLYPEQKNCLLLFVYLLFEENIAAGDLDRLQTFLMFNVPTALFPETIEIFFEGAPLEPPRIPLIHARMKDLTSSGYLEEINFNGHISWRISQAFSNLAPVLYERLTNGKPNAKIEIPAADRFVEIGDNLPHIVEARQALSELSRAVKEANHLTANPEDQIRLSKEVDYIGELISQPRMHVSALWDAARHNSTLKWLMEQTISGVVRDIAVKAFEHLDKLLSALK